MQVYLCFSYSVHFREPKEQVYCDVLTSQHDFEIGIAVEIAQLRIEALFGRGGIQKKYV